jgi:hypothetical protein
VAVEGGTRDGLPLVQRLPARIQEGERRRGLPRDPVDRAEQVAQAIRGRNESTSILDEDALTFDRTFGGLHSLNVVGYTRQRQENTSTSMLNEQFLSDVLDFEDIGGGNRSGGPVVSSGSTRTTIASYLGRVNYNLLGRYIFTVSGRRDGSSRFGPERKWGFFPSAAVAWRASEEPFLRDVGALSELKLRASYGRRPLGEQRPQVGLSAGLVEDKYRFFPIPSSARSTNPQLTQNPGW